MSIFIREGPEFTSGIANQVKLELNFTLQQLKVSIGLTDKVLQTEKESLEFIVDDISTEILLRRWDMFVNANIGRLVLKEMTWGEEGRPFEILSTPKNTKMLQVTVRKCQFNESLNFGPSYYFSDEAQIRALHFKDEFQATDQIIDVQMATLFLVLHQEALMSIMSLVYQVLEPLNKRDAQATTKIKRSLSAAGSRLSLSMEEREKKRNEKRRTANTKTLQAAKELKEKVGVEEEKKMTVTASLEGVGIMICSAKVDLAQAYVRGFSTKILMKDNILEVKASMKDMQIKDNVGVTKYQDIVSMQSNEVFDLELALYENGSKGTKQYDMSCVDTSVKLSFGQMRVVFLYRFIMDLLNFVDNFEDAKNAVIEAGIAAKDKAVETASDISRHSSRVQLNVLLKAPTIVVPVGSNSELSLLVDLGELRVFNVFKLLNDDGSKYHKNAIITDNMTVKLSDLKVMKALLKNGEEVMHRRDIVEPMMLQINIVRNLTSSNHSIPDIQVQGNMPAITLSISEEDVAVALKIVKGNLAEGEAHAPKKKRKPKQDLLNVPKDRLADIYEEPEDDQTSAGGYLQTKLMFDLVKIDLKLYLKPPDMTFEDEFLERTEDLLLSLFTVGNLKFDGSIMSDQSMCMTVQLDTLILDDMRPLEDGGGGKEDVGVNRMINYSPEPLIKEIARPTTPVETHGMINVKFEQNAAQDKNVDVKISNMLLIFNVEFIMVLARTLQAAVPKEDEIDRARSLSSLESIPGGSGGSEDEGDSAVLYSDIVVSSEETNDDDDTSPRSETRLRILVYNPQIVLLADAKDVKTNALFLTTEVNFQYYELQDVQKMIGVVSNTAVLSTAFKKEHRSDISTVFSLDSINLHSSAPVDGKPHVHLTTSLVKLNISPKTIRTLSACSGHMVSEPSADDIKEAEKTMTNLWHIRDLTTKKSWYLNHPPQHVLSAGSFVLARTATGEYKNGFLAKKDTQFQVFFYHENIVQKSILHKALDVSAVVLDLVPFEVDLFVGCNVLAFESKEKGYRTGRIIQVCLTRFRILYTRYVN